MQTLRTAEARYNSSFLIFPMPSALPTVSVIKFEKNYQNLKQRNTKLIINFTNKNLVLSYVKNVTFRCKKCYMHSPFTKKGKILWHGFKNLELVDLTSDLIRNGVGLLLGWHGWCFNFCRFKTIFEQKENLENFNYIFFHGICLELNLFSSQC